MFLLSLIKKSLRTGLEKVNSLISAKIDSKPELNDLSKILFQRKLKINLLDIGSLGALGSNDPVYKNFNQNNQLLNLICFEPQTIKGKVDFPSYDLALYKTKGQINLNILKSKPWSSIYSPNVNYLKQFYNNCSFLQIEQQQQCKCITLDDIEQPLDFIKIDVQGAEYDIFAGGKQSLKNVIGLVTEVEFAPLYIDQPLFSDIDTLLRKHDFEIYDLKKSYFKRHVGANLGGPKGQLLAGDALYFKKMDSLLQMDLDKQFKAVYLFCLYGYISDAYYLYSQSASLQKEFSWQPQEHPRTGKGSMIAKKLFKTLAAYYDPHRWHRDYIGFTERSIGNERSG